MTRTTIIVSIDTGDNLETTHVMRGGYTDESHAAHVARKTNELLKAGYTLVRDNGDRVWRERFEDTQNGRLVWHDDGNRHRCTWYEITETQTGEQKKRKLQTVWANYR